MHVGMYVSLQALDWENNAMEGKRRIIASEEKEHVCPWWQKSMVSEKKEKKGCGCGCGPKAA